MGVPLFLIVITALTSTSLDTDLNLKRAVPASSRLSPSDDGATSPPPDSETSFPGATAGPPSTDAAHVPLLPRQDSPTIRFAAEQTIDVQSSLRITRSVETDAAKPGRVLIAEGLEGEGPDLRALVYDGHTAVYDITARVLYLPSGVALEAHSGMGKFRDDPAHTDRRMLGATPPATYDLTPRESLFHGARALRMTAVPGSNVERVGS